jgi:hypothetical protein
MKHARKTFNFWKLWLALGIVCGVLIALYGAAAYYFSSHFGFNTSIDNINCSFRTVAEVEQIISERVEDHRIVIKGRDGLNKTLTAADVALIYKPDGQIQAILEAQNPFTWIVRLFRDPREATTHASVGLDEKKLTAAIKKLDLFNEKQAKPPVDAHPKFSDSRYVVCPEDPGSTLDETRTRAVIDEALRTLAPTLDLDEAGCYVSPKIFANNPDLISQVEHYNTYAPFEIVYTFGEATEVLDASVALEWVDIAQDGTGTLNEEALTAWMQDFGLRHDTIGSKRTFKTVDGEEIFVEGGTYGWEVDEEAEIAAIKEAFAKHSGERRDPYYIQTADLHAKRGMPDWGKTYIELDLTKQHMYYIVDGEIDFEADVVTGAPWGGRATPAGVYRVLEKLSPTILKGDIMPNGKREYETPVTFWMRITWGGVGFHDATWQPSFGGNRYTYAGSHGCINMSYTDAQTLYDILEVGTPVISHY